MMGDRIVRVSALLSRRYLCKVLGVLLLGAAICLPIPAPVLAFSSYPWGAPHDQITDAAASSLGLSWKTRSALKKATRAPDWDESNWDPGLAPSEWKNCSANPNYRPEHHFDRPAGQSHSEAFRAGAAYLQSQLAEVIAAIQAGNMDAAIAALGRTLHALQDFKSHSNYVFLLPEKQAQVRAALFDPAAPVPTALRLTGYDPGATDPELPPGDNYAHKKYAMDAKDKYRGKILFEIAKASAIEESIDLLQRVRDAVTTNQWNTLVTHVIAPDPNDSKYAWECTEPCGPAGCLLDCGWAAIQVPAGVFPEPDTVTVLGVPDDFFFSHSMTESCDGARTVGWVELRTKVMPDSVFFQTPLIGTFALSDTVVARLEYLQPSSLIAYRYGVEIGDWAEVAGSVIDITEATAILELSSVGTYAVGGFVEAQPPIAGCCFIDSPCQDLTKADCENLGGEFRCAGSSCDPDPCGELGSCCLYDGSCVLTLGHSECMDVGGYLYQGDGSVCDPDSCPQPGPCCFAQNDCQLLVQDVCEAAGGQWWGSEVESCDSDPCALMDVNAGGCSHGARLLPAQPNPFIDSTVLTYNLERPSRVSMIVYDVSGRVVRRLDLTTRETCYGTIEWDGYNDAGVRVTPGIYFCRMTAGGVVAAQRMIVAESHF